MADDFTNMEHQSLIQYCSTNFSMDKSGDARHFYHLCSEGTHTDVLFHNGQEFIMGMNIVALSVMKSDVEILAFCLMDNHFHFIVSATTDQLDQFKNCLVQKYNRRKSLCAEQMILEKIKWSALLIKDVTYLKRSIAYVLNNPLQVGYSHCVFYYPWSSGSLYFKDEIFKHRELMLLDKVSDVPLMKQRKMMGSKNLVNQDWFFTPEGFVWPGSYVNVRLVEFVYGTPKHFSYYLTSRTEADQTALEIGKERIFMTDIEVVENARKLCQERFGHAKISLLDYEQRTELAEVLMKRTRCSEKQLFKTFHLEKI